MTYHVRVKNDTVCIYQDADLVRISEKDAEKLIMDIAAAVVEIRKEKDVPRWG